MLRESKNFLIKNKHHIFWAGILLIIIYLIFPDVETIKSSFEEIKGADPLWIIFAALMFLLGLWSYDLQLVELSDIKLRKWVTFKVQMAMQFVNKILPISISGLVVNSFYLHEVGHKPSQTTSILAIRSVTSSIGFIIIAILAIISGLKYLTEIINAIDFNAVHVSKLIPVLVIAVLSLFWVLLKIQKTREFLHKTVKSFWGQFKSYKTRKDDVFWAIIYGGVATITGLLMLYSSAHALGLSVNFSQTFFIFTLGNTLAALVPVPGGIGAAEAGLYAGFVFLGFPPDTSIAAVTLYRLISFWIPLIPGTIFFINLRKDLLANFTFNTDFIKARVGKKAATAS